MKLFCFLFVLIVLIGGNLSCKTQKSEFIPINKSRTILNDKEKLGEPFGIAERNGELFVSDGETGKIWRVANYENFTLVTDKFDTPSAIAFDKNADLIVADSGSHTIKRLNLQSGEIVIVAGRENQKGFADGDAKSALFNAPIGIAVSDEKIFVADTYNDKIRVVENGVVSTVAGGEQGFADGAGSEAKFDTPCGIAVWKEGKIIVADTGNRRLRVVKANGNVRTLAGGAEEYHDGFSFQAGFAAPTALAIDSFGVIYIADGNSVRAIGRKLFPLVETITHTKRGFADGNLRNLRLNRPSGLATDEKGNIFIADAENQAIRVLTGAETGVEITKEKRENLRFTPEEFRNLQPPRWTYNPPENKREIAGTLGEIRGEIVDQNSQAWFHNGLDIVGGYGETARFIRTEKVLRPAAIENFATSRELIRMPTIGYIHIRMGRDKDDKIFDDNRFEFSLDADRKLKGVRVPRGTKFQAGEAIGTLNALNHVHLIAGRSGAEMNALDALEFPGISDSIAPTIEKVSLFDENWRVIETVPQTSRIKINDRTRIVVRAYDRMDGNSERRRLGVYRIGYQILNENKTPLSEIRWTISFDRMPDADAVKYVYAPKSRSGATGETIFNYIASNFVNADIFREDFLDAQTLENGNYTLRVAAADFFGNQTVKDVEIVK